ncbi:substrate-binding periplasmic protein [Psychromonas aquimarina]|uniref:substrate-binding periplasmic protein n=1 Tax=Psychromonas aquimarina TaxID=444919 RepID=UPI00040EFB57|nr:ABC transporter substrate-binding protein [Psychromonas aquimarina]
MSGNSKNSDYVAPPPGLINISPALLCRALVLVLLLLLSVSTLRAEPLNILTYEESPYALMVGKTQKGLLVDMLAELFSRTSLRYKLRFIPLKRAIITVERKPGYCVLPIVRSQEREANFQWISPMLVSRYGLFSQEKRSIPLVTLNDARPYKIGSFLGSGIGEYLLDLGFKVELTSLSALNLHKLKRGRFELWAADLISAREMMRKQGIKFGRPELVFYTSIRAMACYRGMPAEQLSELQNALLSMYQDGFMKALYLEYGVDM